MMTGRVIHEKKTMLDMFQKQFLFVYSDPTHEYIKDPDFITAPVENEY